MYRICASLLAVCRTRIHRVTLARTGMAPLPPRALPNTTPGPLLPDTALLCCVYTTNSLGNTILATELRGAHHPLLFRILSHVAVCAIFAGALCKS